MTPLQITLVILLVTIIAFASGKIPIAVISSGIMIALILTAYFAKLCPVSMAESS